MVVFSISFLLISYILTNILGPVGFIVANCINMAARIIHSLYFIHEKFLKTGYKPIEGLIPDKKYIAILVISGIGTKLSEKCILPNTVLGHIGIGMLLLLGTLVVWAIDNQTLLKLGYAKYKRKLSIKTD